MSVGGQNLYPQSNRAFSMTDLTAAELLDAQARGETSAEAITRAYLDALRRAEPKVKAFLQVDEDGALEQARAVDARRKQGQPLGALAGLPVAVKDVLCTQGK